MTINPEEIGALVAAGKLDEAATAAMDAGMYEQAAAIYEKLWDFRGVLVAARALGDAPRVLRCAIELDDAVLVDAQVRVMIETDEGAKDALDMLVKMRRHALAAPIAERLGDARAIDLYTRAHRDLDAARLLEASGRDRDAGKLLERALDLAAADERAPIQLALGRILARRGAYPEATRLLQEAKKTPAQRADAQRHLIATLAAMGLRDGARDALMELRASDPKIEADLDVYLRGWRDESTERRQGGRDREVVAGRYRLDKMLGAGGSGRVFLATDEVAGRQVAIKMFFAAGARGGAAYERFVREARLAATLRHPSLVEVYDVSVERGYLVMEFLPGGSLAQRIAAGERLAPAIARRMALDVIGGLEAAHHRGVVHRDVKPANIFFDARGTAKLGDFGVAHLVDLGQTQTGGLIGTLAYMSPEQITGAPISIAADLYALGITLYEVVTGWLPFLGPDFVAQHLGEMPAAATSVNPAIAPGWDPILAALLVKNPQERTGTLAELRHELENLDLGARPLMGVRPKRESKPYSIVAVAAEGEAKPRYQFETPLGTTAVSQLARAVDTVLDRSVVIERFTMSEEADAAMGRAQVLARAQSPFVQRALSFDRLTRTMIFEAPSGASVADASPKLSAADALRLLKRLARGAAAIHELGGTHGAIAAHAVVLDHGAVPTVMAAGLGAVDAAKMTAAADVDAIVSLVAATISDGGTHQPTFAELARAATAEVGARLPTFAPPTDGETLYAAADAVDIAVLAALGSR